VRWSSQRPPRNTTIASSHDERYLKAYCPEHNRLAAEHVYGEKFITEKIEAKRAANSNP